MISPFNSSIETGIRALVILDSIFPSSLDLQRLVEYDYLTVHTGDAGGPSSIHPPLPLRTSELLVRREIIENGINLMLTRNLIIYFPGDDGLRYQSTDQAGAFLNSLSSKYILKLRDRANWVTSQFSNYTDEELFNLTQKLFDKWTTQFEPIKPSKGSTK